MFDGKSSVNTIVLLNKFPVVKKDVESSRDTFTEYFMNIVTMVLNEPQHLRLFLISLKAVVNQMLPCRPPLIRNCIAAMQTVIDTACLLPPDSIARCNQVALLETCMQNALMMLPGMFAATTAAINASHNHSTIDVRVVEVLANPNVSERWRLLEAQHLRRLSIKDLILSEDATAWSALFLQLLDLTDTIQQKQLNLTSGVLQVLIMACSTQVDTGSLPLTLVSTIVASFSSVVASSPCFFAQDSVEYMRAAKWTDVAVALDIIGNLLGIIIQIGDSGGSAAAAAIGYVKICFTNISKLCLCFPAIEPSDHAVAHIAAWYCLSNCCTQALHEGRESLASGLILELFVQVDVLSLLLKRCENRLLQ
jgi:hypothetical protein